MMKKTIQGRKIHMKVKNILQDMIQKLHLEEYKRTILRHRSSVTNILDLVQGDNYYLMNKPYPQQWNLRILQKPTKMMNKRKTYKNMKVFMMKKNNQRSKIHRKFKNILQYMIQKFYLEEYKRIIPRHISSMKKMLESVQGDNYYLMNKPYSQQWNLSILQKPTKVMNGSIHE